MRAASTISMGREASRYCFMKKKTVGAAMLGTISGMKLFFRPILEINCRKPSADTCVGMVMMSRIRAKAAFLNLKL